MIEPEHIRALSNSQLSEFRRFDLDCEDMKCHECPLGMTPVTAKLNNGRDCVFKCATAYANYFYNSRRYT